jgi:hypothetical protein
MAGVPQSFQLSPSEHGASSETYGMRKPTNSGVENIRALGRSPRPAFVRCYSCLRLTPMSKRCSTRKPGKRREKYAYGQHGRVFTPSPSLGNPYTIQLERYYKSLLPVPAKGGKRNQWERLRARSAWVCTQLIVPATPCLLPAFQPLDTSQGLSSQVLCQSLAGKPDQDYIDEWYRINGKESNYKGQKHVKEYSASVGSVVVNASDVVCILQQSAATIQLADAAQVRALGQSLIAAADQMTAAPVNPATPVGTTNHASSSFVYSQNAKVFYGDDRPGAKMSRARNEATMRYSLENERRASMDRAIQRLSALGRRW